MKPPLDLALAALLLSAPSSSSQGFSTFLGGPSNGYGTEHIYSVTVDSTGHGFVGGFGNTSAFPAARRYGTGESGGFVAKLSPDGSRLAYSTFFENIEIVAVRWAGLSALYALAHTGGPQPALGFSDYAGGHTDLLVLKLGADGELLWVRGLGGSDLEVPRSIAIDTSGRVLVAGFTTSTNFPATEGALQSAASPGFNGFLAALDPDGAMRFSTYLGGEGDEFIHSIAANSSGEIFVAGVTSSAQLAGAGPIAAHGPLGGSDAFVASVRADGAALNWFARLGGASRDSAVSILVETNGSLALLGATSSPDFPVSGSALQSNLLGNSDLFLARLTADGQQLLASTYFGSVESEDLGDPFWASFLLDGEVHERHIFLDNAGFAAGPGGTLHLAARNNSGVFPAFPGPVAFGGNREAFFARVSPDLSSIQRLATFGSSTDDEARTLAVDSAGNVWLAGTAYSPSTPPFFATSPGALQPDFAGGAMDGFIVKIPAADPPVGHDAFAQRIALSGARLAATVSIDGATLEPSEPDHPSPLAKSVWFSWRAPGPGRLVASTAGSTVPAAVALYSGTNLSSLELIARTPQASADPAESRVAIPILAGFDYQIAVLAESGATGLCWLSLSFSEAPNDDFNHAALLAGFPVAVAATNRFATAEPGEPGHHENNPSRSLWWKWVAPAIQGSVAVSTIGSDFDTVLAIYTGTLFATLQRVASNDDAVGGGTTSEIAFLPEPGRTYLIAVDGQRDQSGAVRLRLASNDPPPNDSFASPLILAGTLQNIVASNLRATMQPGEPALQFTNALGEIDQNFSRSTVWWQWQAPKTGRLRLDTIGSDFDTRLGIYKGAVLSNLTLLASSNDLDPATQLRASRLELDVAEGETFAIQVDGSVGSPQGVLRLNLRLAFPPRILPAGLKLSDGRLQLTAEGVLGERYRIESSTDLRTWAPASEYVTGQLGLWTFTEPATGSRLFLRLASEP